MHWYAGTSGYSYAAWKGSFYPRDLPGDAMLGHYAGRLPAVEINNTFYRMPRSSVLENWAAAVPETFRFVIKASRRITHQLRLKGAAEPTDYLLERASLLGQRLGAVLFQLPPNLPKDLDRLAAFLEVLDQRVPAAFEFRHPSWQDDAVLDLLRDAGAALCICDDDGVEPAALTATAPWVYLRLRRTGYGDTDLQRWLAAGAASGARTGYAFFKHEDAGAGPALAARFLDLANGAAPPRRTRRAARPPKGVPARPGIRRVPGSGA